MDGENMSYEYFDKKNNSKGLIIKKDVKAMRNVNKVLRTYPEDYRFKPEDEVLFVVPERDSAAINKILEAV